MKKHMALLLVAGGALAGAIVAGGGLAVAKPAFVTGARSAGAVAGAVPPGVRQALADSCPGYNAALVEAAALASRINKPGEAARFMAMRQNCDAQAAAYYRSAR